MLREEVGLTGTKDEIDRVVGLYGAAYRVVKQDSATDYAVDHSSASYVIAQDGSLSQILTHGTQPEEIVRVLRNLLGTPDVATPDSATNS